jgi:hypothetical protein
MTRSTVLLFPLFVLSEIMDSLTENVQILGATTLSITIKRETYSIMMPSVLLC